VYDTLDESIGFNKDEHHFYINSGSIIDETKLMFPLSVSLQVTRECNLSCEYCSEVGDMPTPPIATIKKMISELVGAKRIIITGGEPLTRRDLLEVVRYAKEIHFETISLATNGTLMTTSLANYLRDLVDYVDVTLDGPRKIHNKIRGGYDEVIKGINALKTAGLSFSVVSVLFRENVNSIFYVCQMADVLGATKLKIMTPITKGKGKNIASEILSSHELKDVFQKIKSEKERNGWMMRISLTDWNKIGEGHAILVHPNGDVVASPVPSKENCIDLLGNLLNENFQEIWKRYPYKKNHLNKYIEKSLYVC